MHNPYETLDNILVKKIRLYEEIIDAMKEEWASITGYSREKLENTIERKELLLAKVHDLNHQREDLVAKLAKQLGRKSSEVTLKTIISLKDNLWGKRMAVHRSKMRELIKTIHQMNIDNKQLIARSSQAMKKSMSWLYEVDQAYTPYHANGQLDEPIMESRVVNTDI